MCKERPDALGKGEGGPVTVKHWRGSRRQCPYPEMWEGKMGDDVRITSNATRENKEMWAKETIVR